MFPLLFPLATGLTSAFAGKCPESSAGAAMTNSNGNENRIANDSAAANENAIAQTVNVFVGADGKGGLTPTRMAGGGGSCYGQCPQCKTTTPEKCPIARAEADKLKVDYSDPTIFQLCHMG